MSHVASFLPEPFWNHRIMERSKCMEDIWETFNYIFSVETSAESFLDLALIEYNSTESHHCFLARIIYHIENNKCPPKKTFDGLDSGENGDSMNITMMDLAVTCWLEKIDKCLIHQVKIEYAIQIKEGKRLFELSS